MAIVQRVEGAAQHTAQSGRPLVGAATVGIRPGQPLPLVQDVGEQGGVVGLRAFDTLAWSECRFGKTVETGGGGKFEQDQLADDLFFAGAVTRAYIENEVAERGCRSR